MSGARGESECRSVRAAGAAALLTALLFLPASLAAPKTDVVVMINGDRITGEVKLLASGQLKYKTDDLGTIYIEWIKILRLTTKQVLRVETREGSVYVGSAPEESEDRILRLVAGESGSTVDVPMDDIVGCKPLDTGSFFKRLDGSFDVGYDFTKSTGVESFSASFDLKAKTQKREWGISAFSNISDSDSEEASKRYNFSGTTRWIFPRNQFLETFAQLDSNTALALNFRALAGGAYGAYLVRSQYAALTLAGGPAYSFERFSDGTSQNGLSGALGLAVNVYVLDSPKKTVSGYIYVFPGLTEWGRFRADANVQMRLEIVKDFFFELGFYGNYDNQAEDEGGESYDYGVTTSLGYTF